MFLPTVVDDIKLNAPKTFQEIYFTSKGSFRSIEQVLDFIKDQNITKEQLNIKVEIILFKGIENQKKLGECNIEIQFATQSEGNRQI